MVQKTKIESNQYAGSILPWIMITQVTAASDFQFFMIGLQWGEEISEAGIPPRELQSSSWE